MAFVTQKQGAFTVIGGDFNSPPESPQIQVFQDRWQDACGEFHPDVAGFTCCTDDLTDESEPHDLWIDYLFFVGQSGINEISGQRVFAQPFETETGWLWASDHIGVMATLSEP
jgi:endonuclease/exonuclease/phosphatase family metal-dependent hydrolase